MSSASAHEEPGSTTPPGGRSQRAEIVKDARRERRLLVSLLISAVAVGLALSIRMMTS